MAGGTYWWGTFGPKVKGIVTYSLSPFEQKAFRGFFSEGIPELYRRFADQSLTIIPIALFTYGVYTWAKKDHDRRLRKDVKHYERLAEEASRQPS
jgi:ubiquinol-cytochrome c reductase subunit 8